MARTAARKLAASEPHRALAGCANQPVSLTAKAEVNGVKSDGVDLFLFDPHIAIDISDDGIQALATGPSLFEAGNRRIMALSGNHPMISWAAQTQ